MLGSVPRLRVTDHPWTHGSRSDRRLVLDQRMWNNSKGNQASEASARVMCCGFTHDLCQRPRHVMRSIIDDGEGIPSICNACMVLDPDWFQFHPPFPVWAPLDSARRVKPQLRIVPTRFSVVWRCVYCVCVCCVCEGMGHVYGTPRLRALRPHDLSTGRTYSGAKDPPYSRN